MLPPVTRDVKRNTQVFSVAGPLPTTPQSVGDRTTHRNVAARLFHARTLTARLPGNYPWADAFTTALERLRALPAYG